MPRLTAVLSDDIRHQTQRRAARLSLAGNPGRQVVAMLLGVSCLAAWVASPVSAQTKSDQPAVQAPTKPDGDATSGSGAKDMGSTGWTGPHRGEQSGTDDDAAGQPLTATGADLKGEPRRLPPSKTPE